MKQYHNLYNITEDTTGRSLKQAVENLGYSIKSYWAVSNKVCIVEVNHLPQQGMPNRISYWGSVQYDSLLETRQDMLVIGTANLYSDTGIPVLILQEEPIKEKKEMKTITAATKKKAMHTLMYFIKHPEEKDHNMEEVSKITRMVEHTQGEYRKLMVGLLKRCYQEYQLYLHRREPRANIDAQANK